MHTTSPITSTRNTRRAAALLGCLTLVVAACGGSETAAPAAAPVAAPVAEAAAEPAAVPATAAPVPTTPAATAGTTELGDVLVGERGLTLYGFVNDNDATSACYGTCADAWPPVIVSADWTVAPGLDSGIFNATVRDDGQLQLVAGKWPLYYFAGDATAGDVNGQGSGDVWFAVSTDGILVEEATGAAATDAAATESAEEAPVATDAPAATSGIVAAVPHPDFGEILVDADGLTLYGFTSDTDGQPTCNDACADAWPPILVEGGELPAGLDPAVYSVVTRDDGTAQLAAGVWPLYLFAGDAAAGDTNGQGSGDVWFVVSADGGLVKDAVESGGYDY